MQQGNIYVPIYIVFCERLWFIYLNSSESFIALIYSTSVVRWTRSPHLKNRKCTWKENRPPHRQASAQINASVSISATHCGNYWKKNPKPGTLKATYARPLRIYFSWFCLVLIPNQGEIVYLVQGSQEGEPLCWKTQTRALKSFIALWPTVHTV